MTRMARVRVMLGTSMVALYVASSGASQANTGVRRLPPSAFPELPQSIGRYLQRRGCTVPQADQRRPVGVLSGHFTSAIQADLDWAVLCSARGMSTILVFRNGSTNIVSEVASGADQDDRLITLATPTALEMYRSRYKGWAPKGGFDHDGIEDGTEKGGTLHYWSGKYWYDFLGAD